MFVIISSERASFCSEADVGSSFTRTKGNSYCLISQNWQLCGSDVDAGKSSSTRFAGPVLDIYDIILAAMLAGHGVEFNLIVMSKWKHIQQTAVVRRKIPSWFAGSEVRIGNLIVDLHYATATQIALFTMRVCIGACLDSSDLEAACVCRVLDVRQYVTFEMLTLVFARGKNIVTLQLFTQKVFINSHENMWGCFFWHREIRSHLAKKTNFVFPVNCTRALLVDVVYSNVENATEVLVSIIGEWFCASIRIFFCYFIALKKKYMWQWKL